MTTKFVVIADRGDFLRPYLIIGVLDEHGDLSGTVKALQVDRVVSAGEQIEPTLTGRTAREFLQSALDSAWEVGLRPTGVRLEPPSAPAPAPSQEGEIARMEAHIDDLRRMVFGSRPILIEPDQQPTSRIATGD